MTIIASDTTFKDPDVSSEQLALIMAHRPAWAIDKDSDIAGGIPATGGISTLWCAEFGPVTILRDDILQDDGTITEGDVVFRDWSSGNACDRASLDQISAAAAAVLLGVARARIAFIAAETGKAVWEISDAYIPSITEVWMLECTKWDGTTEIGSAAVNDERQPGAAVGDQWQMDENCDLLEEMTSKQRAQAKRVSTFRRIARAEIVSRYIDTDGRKRAIVSEIAEAEDR